MVTIIRHPHLPYYSLSRVPGGEGRGEGLRARAKWLRKNSTDAENKLWFHLRNRNLGNLKFRRQVIIGRYIVDFLSHEIGLIIEVDGGQHVEQLTYDKKRKLYLNQQGFNVLRFWNNQILEEMEEVLNEILRTASLIKTPHPTPLPEYGERE